MEDQLKSIAIIADTHCGHVDGLTPPAWWQTDTQRSFWEWFRGEAKSVGKLDAVIGNGDLIDGDNRKHGGLELITRDRLEQAAMAVECLRQFKTKTYHVIAGTPYHCGNVESFENVIASKVGCKLREQLEFTAEDVIFSMRHHVGGSSVPHGAATAPMRNALNKFIDSVIHGELPADVYVRSHLHKTIYIESLLGTALVTPGMQLGSSFGTLRCEGTISVGFVVFRVEGKGRIECEKHLLDVRPYRQPRVKI